MPQSSSPLVSVVMGSDSDLPLMKPATEMLEQFNVPHEVRIVSAHRTPELAHEYARTLADRGVAVVIAAAGGAAHLAGVIASLTPLPVIGVPVVSDFMGGLDSLLSMVQMPSGVPVAVVAAGKSGPKNAAILAAQILGVKDPAMRRRVSDYKANLARQGSDKDKALRG
ncbi:MAG: 5-(carboxyamino)imidazole ribonucleotide mutase [Planctomycetes bacterium]|nr:5-(carboxyamino)imidazole ribonucleotide mutase [Planctomycetota bacterium]